MDQVLLENLSVREMQERPGRPEAAREPSRQIAVTASATPEKEAGAPLPVTEKPAPEASVPAVPAPTPAAAEDPPGRVEGLILDASTGKPVEGARVLLGVTRPDGSDAGWFGDRTRADGAYRFEPARLLKESRREEVPKGLRFEIRVRAAGYQVAKIPVTGSEHEVRLAPDLTPPIPGSVRGVASRSDGTAFRGRLKVECYEAESGWYQSPWAWADEGGNYAIVGMPAGTWSINVSGGGKAAKIVVPEGGEAWLPLVVPARGVDEGSDTFPEETRGVVVTGLPPDVGVGSFVRAETRPGHFTRAPVVEGSARFAALPARNYRFVLERPGRPDVAVEGSVARGEGSQAIPFGR